MSKQANPVAIGGFVLGALGLVVLAILVLSSGSLFREKHQVVSYFPGTVQGLTVGAQVEFQGVQVGEVTEIRLDYLPEDSEFLIPVFFDIWPDVMNVQGKHVDEIEGKAPIVYFVEERGLRARLDSVSLVTGQYMIGLSLRPDTPVEYTGRVDQRIEVPTVKATRDKVSNMLQDLDLAALVGKATDSFVALKETVSDPALHTLLVDADKTLLEFKKLAADANTDIKPLLELAETTLGDYAELAQTASRRLDTLADSIEQTSTDIGTFSRKIDKQVGPIGKSALDVIKSVEGLVGEDSTTRYDLDLLLEEGAGAARSLRQLADYLEQNPDALIKGKYGGGN